MTGPKVLAFDLRPDRGTTAAAPAAPSVPLSISVGPVAKPASVATHTPTLTVTPDTPPPPRRPRHRNRTLARAALPLAVLPLLAGCNLAPKYVQPVAPVPEALPQGGAYPVLGAGESAVDTIGWRDFFTDPRLRQVIATALAENYVGLPFED